MLSLAQVDRIIEMAWEDRTPFEAIFIQFGLAEADVVVLMRRELRPSSFRLWRERVHQKVSHKHLYKRAEAIERFRCSRQRSISGNKISKRS
ncbi:MAG: TIGR03643 family protein [Sphingomonadales bacterium]|nr:TIGR03643 family protein [Sphingomonadales bacterium]